MAIRQGSRNREHGQSIIETALLAPWIFILFMGIVDFGFYAYSMVAVENAARVAALFTSQSDTSASDQAGACVHARNELRMVPNFASLPANCSSLPLDVRASQVSAANSADGELGTQVSVQYQSIPMFPIPGVTGRLTVTRIVQMRVED